MAASRRGQSSLSIRLPSLGTPALLPDLPPISALFLIDFDVKAGYTIVWKEAAQGLEIEGLVEYKSLPSGLHTVTEDLIYFVHDERHAGLSAFVNAPTDEEEARHAHMIAVGVLVPLSFGRLGRAWRHAEYLKAMAEQLAADRERTDVLQQYWEVNRVQEPVGSEDTKEPEAISPSITFQPSRPARGHARNRSASDGAALLPPGHKLSPYHPAWSLQRLLETFGPLVFPIHRAALLRRRILISCHAPVHEVCNFVYDISILANIPLSVYDIISPSAPSQRMRPLFTVGVHDIPFLLEDHEASKRAHGTDDDSAMGANDSASGWIACTTDSILALKDSLWDVLITMPPTHAAHAKEKVWPTMESPKGTYVKATQRDLRRFRALRTGLSRFSAELASQSPPPPEARQPATASSPPPPSPPPPRTDDKPNARGDGPLSDAAADKIVEPHSWAALAYSGFMWWASAGDTGRSEEAEEAAHDAGLLADLLAPAYPQAQAPMTMPRPASSRSSAFDLMASSVTSLTARRTSNTAGGSGGGGAAAAGGGGGRQAGEEDGDAEARAELAIIAYFHRLTTQVLSVLADIVECSEDSDDEVFGPEGSDAGSDEDALLGPGEEEAGRRGWLRVDSDALANMGLDVWSDADADFVREICARYFGRKAYVEGKGVEVCGVRVC